MEQYRRRENSTRSAFLIIDMENGFVSPESAHCIRMAAATVPTLIRAAEAAREKGIPVFFVKRIYRGDGSDVELTRYAGWKEGGRAMTPASAGSRSAQAPEGLEPQPGDYTIIKPRWSAFFHTELDLILRRLDVRTVILTGTTTPNCIRTTAYDANSLDYNVVVLEDCCSSQTPEIQRANLDDLRRMGAVILSAAQFEEYDEHTVPDLARSIREELPENGVPEPIGQYDGWTGWPDRW
ncbi:MAG: cysteine hydrolase family protein [Candidatus Onthomonas sp.]